MANNWQTAKIEAVTFDVGGTLIEPWPSVGHVYAAVAERHGIGKLSPDLLNERFKAAWHLRKSFSDTRAGWEELVDEVFQGLAGTPPRASFFPELYDRFADPDVWRVYDDVIPALEELASRGLRLGVLSNWDERLRPLLRSLRLDRYFEAVIVSCEIGFSKPSPVIFEQSALKLGAPPAAILHVGDSREQDVDGARAAGFQAVRIRRGASESGPDDIPSLAAIAAGIAPQISRR